MISPTSTAPTIEPTKAPTIPPQKRSGRKIVKCQIAKPMITQPSMPISAHPLCRISRASPSAPAVPAVTRAFAAAFRARFRVVLHHEALCRQIGGRVGCRLRCAVLLALWLDLLARLRSRWLLRDPAGARAARGAAGPAVRRARLAVDVEVAYEFLKLVA